MTLDEIRIAGIGPALALLPPKMTSPQALTMLYAIGLQESRFLHRKQMGNGPARSFWQFEQGGGVKGVLNHEASREFALVVCAARGVAPVPAAVWRAMETDDVLGAAFSRLLLRTDPKPLPVVDDAAGGWALYLRTWRPGKPHPETWPGYHAQARDFIFQPPKGNT